MENLGWVSSESQNESSLASLGPYPDLRRSSSEWVLVPVRWAPLFFSLPSISPTEKYTAEVVGSGSIFSPQAVQTLGQDETDTQTTSLR